MIEFYNPNPTCKYFKSGKPKNWYINDSAIRAVAKALNMTWGQAYDELVNTGKKVFNIPTSKQVVDEVLRKHGFEYFTYGKPGKDQKRANVKQFIETTDTSNKLYVLNLADYFVCLSDNKIYDVSDSCIKNSVYSYWTKDI